jgi:hypothetical protein
VLTELQTRKLAALLALALIAAPHALVASPAVAQPAPAGTLDSVAGRMLVTPRSDALVKRLPARIVVRVPARTTRLLVRVGGRDVSRRFGVAAVR